MPAEDATLRGVTPLLEPRSIALVGANDRTGEIVEEVFASRVPAFVVNPRRRSVLGRTCFGSIADLPDRPDVAVMLVGHRRLLEAATAAVKTGVGALVVPGLGAEAGREAGEILTELGRLAADAGTAVLGPNCMGFANTGGVSLWIGSLPETLRRGAVSVVAQSGSVAEGLAALGGRVGFRFIVSSGGEVARDAADFVAHFAKDPETTAVGLFLESIRRPASLSAALVACAEAGKPVACLKVGRSKTAAGVALAHTGALVGSAEACSAFLSAHGIIEVEELPDLVEVLEVLGRKRRLKGRRLAAVCESGGEAELLADHADAAGLDVEPLPDLLAGRLADEFPNFDPAQNPVDAWAIDEPERVFPRCLELLADSGRYDILVAQVDLTQYRSHGDNDWCAAIVRGLADAVRGRDVFPAVISSQMNDPPAEIAALAQLEDIALLRGARAASKALAMAAAWRPLRPAPAPPASKVVLSDLLRPGAMSEHESTAVLERYGVPSARHLRAASPDAAADAAEVLGFPVVLKIDGPAHKQAIGGVILGLRNRAEVEQAAAAMGGPVLVASQVPPGVEVICGVHRDAAYGPILVVGLGGAVAEAVGIVARALGPLDGARADDLICSVPGLAGLLAPAARSKVMRVLLGLSSLAHEHPNIVSADVNPLVVRGDEVIAVDGLVVVEECAVDSVREGEDVGQWIS
ncbi:MAG: acetate--CoA ligase family protein [Acidimicrobiales bacterium]